jgi:hypothetical protein
LQTGRIAHQPLFCVDFMTNDATHGGSTDGSGRAAARQNRSTDGADAGADSGVLVLCRHTATSTQTEQHRCGKGTERNSMHRFHGIASLILITSGTA